MTASTAWQTQYTPETRPWAVDMTPEMDPGDVLSGATSTITDLLTGVTSSGAPLLPSGPQVAGNVIIQVVSGLTAGRQYRLMLSGAMGGGKITSVPVPITCPH